MKLLLMFFLTGMSIVESQRPGGLFCTPGFDGSLRIACPKKSRITGRANCITEAQLCNGVRDCKGGDDERPDKCRFYKATLQQHRAISGHRRSAIRQIDCSKCGWWCQLRRDDRGRSAFETVDCSQCGWWCQLQGYKLYDI